MKQRAARKKTRKPKSTIECELQTVQRVARRDGIDVRWTRIQTSSKGKRPCFHVMFDHGSERVLDFWPTSGTARLKGVTTKVIGVVAALEIVKGLSHGR